MHEEYLFTTYVQPTLIVSFDLYILHGSNMTALLMMLKFFTTTWMQVGPDYLTINAWTWTMLIFSNAVLLTRLIAYTYEKIFLGIMGYSFDWLHYYCIVAVFSLLIW